MTIRGLQVPGPLIGGAARGGCPPTLTGSGAAAGSVRTRLRCGITPTRPTARRSRSITVLPECGWWKMKSAKSLPIPNHYGVDDFPVIIQDKRLDNFGTPEYNEPGSGGFVGDTLLVNGVQSPYVEVVARLGALATAERVELPSLSTTDERWSPVACDFRRSGIPACSGIGEATFAGTGRALRDSGGYEQRR